jgi:flavin-dependent dehydrogenase
MLARILAAKIIFGSLLLTGCAAHSVTAPSTAGVQGAVNSANGNVTAAAAANKNAQRYNDLARTGASRIDAKAGVIEKYWDSSK